MFIKNIIDIITVDHRFQIHTNQRNHWSRSTLRASVQAAPGPAGCSFPSSFVHRRGCQQDRKTAASGDGLSWPWARTVSRLRKRYRLQLNRVDLGLEMCVVCPFAGKHLTTTKSLSQLSVPLKSYHFQDPKGITQQVLSEQLVTK